MKVSKRIESDSLKSLIQAAPKNCNVLISAEFAHHFKSVPSDGRTYIVEDPTRKNIHHWTFPDRSYKCVDAKTLPTVGGIPIVVNPKRVFYSDRKNGKQTRLAHKICAKKTVSRQDDSPLTICLIDIHRVMRITGFKRTFIYEQPDFPEPVRLGTSRRSSVRWVESEVNQWVQKLTEKRTTQTIEDTALAVSANTSQNRQTRFQSKAM